MGPGLTTESHGSVWHLMLDVPQRRHALSRDLLEAIASALGQMPEEVTGIVLRGRGEIFSAGADFADLTGTSADVAYDDAVTRVRAAILACPRVVVAAIEGPCLGAAADLALACDFRVIGEGGFLQVPAVRLGLLYSPEALDRYARTYPIDGIRRLFLLGQRLNGPAAQAAGLATTVVPNGSSAAHATALLSGIEPSQREAIAATKGFVTALTGGTLDPEEWQQRRKELLDSPARRTAIAAAHARHVDHHPMHKTKDPR